MEEFQEKIEKFGGEKNLVQSIGISWRHESTGSDLRTEQDFREMVNILYKACKTTDSKNQEANTSDLESSFVSIKFNGSQKVKIVKLTAELQENIAETLQLEPSIIVESTPRDVRNKVWLSESKLDISDSNLKNLNQARDKGVSSPIIMRPLATPIDQEDQNDSKKYGLYQSKTSKT